MSVARIQQILTLSLATLAGSWFGFAAAHISTTAAILGTLAILFGHAGILALEFILLERYGSESVVRRPTFPGMLRAWSSEVFRASVVFGWSQPWRSTAVPDWLPRLRRTGVVLVHGFFCNRAFWNPWMTRLRAAEIPYVAINLE